MSKILRREDGINSISHFKVCLTPDWFICLLLSFLAAEYGFIFEKYGKNYRAGQLTVYCDEFYWMLLDSFREINQNNFNLFFQDLDLDWVF